MKVHLNRFEQNSVLRVLICPIGASIPTLCDSVDYRSLVECLIHPPIFSDPVLEDLEPFKGLLNNERESKCDEHVDTRISRPECV